MNAKLFFTKTNLKHLDHIPKEEQGKYFFLKGKAFNVESQYNPKAEEELGKATKFNFPAAWNELGECLYKKGELAGAKTCFLKALEMVNIIDYQY